MSPKKLSNENKTEILKLYRETGETTSTLAERYEVSSSTISRFLKTHLSETEYEDLIQQKRLARTPKGALILELEKIQQEAIPEVLETVIPPKVATTPTLETKTIAETAAETTLETLDETLVQPGAEKPKSLPKKRIELEKEPEFTARFKPNLVPPPEDEEDEEEDIDQVDVKTLGEMLGEELSDMDDDEDEEDEDEDWDDETVIDYPTPITTTAHIQVLPIETAAFPAICYLVIDRSAELITRPLKEFAELGKIPTEEIQQRTLPVFDNHRVARRFSKRRERVIKVPDGRLIQKASPYLEAKGITRLLLDGQIYSLQ